MGSQSVSRLSNQHSHFTSSPDSRGNTQPVTLGCWCRNASRAHVPRLSEFPCWFQPQAPLWEPGSQRAPWHSVLITCPSLERCSLDSPDKPFVLALCLRICLWKNQHYHRKISFSYANLHVFETRLFLQCCSRVRSTTKIHAPFLFAGCSCSFTYTRFVSFHFSIPLLLFFFFLNRSLAHRLLRNNQAFSLESSQPLKSNNIF